MRPSTALRVSHVCHVTRRRETPHVAFRLDEPLLPRRWGDLLGLVAGCGETCWQKGDRRSDVNRVLESTRWKGLTQMLLDRHIRRGRTGGLGSLSGCLECCFACVWPNTMPSTPPCYRHSLIHRICSTAIPPKQTTLSTCARALFTGPKSRCFPNKKCHNVHLPHFEHPI